jgi:hypothetical protein
MVLPSIAHHVAQRGDRRERTFFEDADYALHLDLLAEAGDRSGAAKKTRTSTGFRPQRPQRCASTNSAMAARA